ncbi:MAG: asparagine synthase (glutamine-hydrolyzing), partial [Terracidiphilus sp.]
MCGIAGAWLGRIAGDGDDEQIGKMIDQVLHRGPDGVSVMHSGHAVLASARLAIVDVIGGQQPFTNETGDIHVVYNGEIYNHRTLRDEIQQRGHRLRSACDGEVISHLYEEFGIDCLGKLDGQFAIAIADDRNEALYLARDRMGICPLHWVQTPEGLYFCSEIKGLRAVGVVPGQVEPRAILQLAYFGAVCAPLTAFAGVQQMRPAHYLAVRNGAAPQLRRYWTLDFPLQGEYAAMGEKQAAEGLRRRLEAAVSSHMQGEFHAACCLSGGIDSAIIAALLARHCGREEHVVGFCASSDSKKMDEGDAAAETAVRLGIELRRVAITEANIAEAFKRLIWHAEVPVISTEAAALLLLSEHIRNYSKIVLTGEGADEAFGGYLAFRQFKVLGGLSNPGLEFIRRFIRPMLQHHYGSECLLPSESRLDAVRETFGCFPAQAYEWEFYRAAITPVLSPIYRELGAGEAQWEGFAFEREAIAGRHWLNRALYVGYQVMLPNYLLGAHGDRVFAANSLEGRYPFLDREV